MVPSPPILWMPVHTAGPEDRRNLLDALLAIRVEDPGVLIRTAADADEVLFSGSSAEHLLKTFSTIADEYRVPGWKGEPRVRYLETIRQRAEAEGKYIRQTGGHGNYAHVKLRLEPNEQGKGIEFRDETKGGVIPPHFIQPIETGIREAAQGGIHAGYEMADLRATLYDGSFHEIDSNDTAYRIAAAQAFREAARKAGPIVLEPVMNVIVTVAESKLAAAIAEIGRHRGRAVSTSNVRGTAIVASSIPLAEMLRDGGLTPTGMFFKDFEPIPSDPDDDPAGSVVRNPKGPKPMAGSAAVDPDVDIGSDWS